MYQARLWGVSFLLLWAVVGCGGGGTNSPPSLSPVSIIVSVPTRQGAPPVAKVVVKVTGPELEGTLTYELPYDAENHQATGTLQVPNGIDRLFVVEALAAEGEVLYTGQTGLVDVDPVQNDPITLELWPSSGRFGWTVFHFNLLDAIPSAYPGIGRIRACYSPFRDGQSPNTGVYPSEEEMREDLTLLQPLVKAVRTFGATHGLERIPVIAQELGIACLAGAWIGKDNEANQQEIQNLIAIAQAGQAEKVAVGSEVLLRGDLTEAELIALIQQVKQQVSVPLSTGAIYQTWLDHPDLAEACDYLLVHAYPYWEGFPAERALERIQTAYQQLKTAYPQKPLVLGEVGWPSGGQTQGQAVPNSVSQRRFVRQVVEWAEAEGMEVYLFEAFDEQWKTAEEGSVGAHWGLFLSDRTMKPEMRKIWF